MGQFLTSTALIQCPHGGVATVITTNAQVSAGGAFVLRSTDIFTIVGCSLAASGTTPPCATIEWIVPALANSVLDDFVLTTDSVGLCLGSPAPGPPIVTATQESVSGL
jgi:hypothetical protein